MTTRPNRTHRKANARQAAARALPDAYTRFERAFQADRRLAARGTVRQRAEAAAELAAASQAVRDLEVAAAVPPAVAADRRYVIEVLGGDPFRGLT